MLSAIATAQDTLIIKTVGTLLSFYFSFFLLCAYLYTLHLDAYNKQQQQQKLFTSANKSLGSMEMMMSTNDGDEKK
jgi:hypothetical protein